MAQFDTKVQEIKNKVLTEVAKEAWNGTLMQNLLDIPKRIVPGRVPTMRCCVYKERAILAERVKIAMGGDEENPNIVDCLRRVSYGRIRSYQLLPRLSCSPL